MMKNGIRSVLLAVAAVVALVHGASDVSAAPETYLALAGDAGESPAGDGARLVTDGTWTVTCYDRNNDGPVDAVVLTYVSEANQEWYSVTMASTPGEPLVPGFYPRATRGSDTGPSLDVVGNGHGCNATLGSFTVLHADFDTTGGELRVRGFAARFEQHCEGGPRALYGVVSYEAPPAPVVTGATYARASGKLTVSGQSLDGVVGLVVDGNPVAAKVKGDVLKAKGVSLGTGVHRLALRSASGEVSPPFAIDFDLGLPAPAPTESTLAVHTDGEDPADQTYRPSSLLIYPGDGDSDGRLDVLSTFLWGAENSFTYELDFGTTGLGPMHVGAYPNAAMYAGDGRPGLNVRGPAGESCFNSTGSFAITDLAVDEAQGFPKVVRFAATFDFTCGSYGPHRTGSFAYYGGTSPALLRAKYDRAARTLALSGLYFSRSATVLVDGKTVAATGSSKTISLAGLDLSGGLHVVAVRNRDGLATAPLVIRV